MSNHIFFLYCKNLNSDKKVFLTSNEIFVIKQQGNKKWLKYPLLVEDLDKFNENPNMDQYGVIEGEYVIRHTILCVSESKDLLQEQSQRKRQGSRRLSLSDTRIPLKYFSAGSVQALGSIDETETQISDVDVPNSEPLQRKDYGAAQIWDGIRSLKYIAPQVEAENWRVRLRQGEVYVGLYKTVTHDKLISSFNDKDSLAERAEKVFQLICSDGLRNYTLKQKPNKRLKQIPQVFVDSIAVILAAMPSTSTCKTVSKAEVQEVFLHHPSVVRRRIMEGKRARKEAAIGMEDSYYTSSDVWSSD